jgi:hypothetical protein
MDILNLKLPRLHLSTWAKDIICKKMILEDDRLKIITIMSSIWESGNKCSSHGESGYNFIVTMEFVRDTLLSLEMPPVLHRPLSTKHDRRWKIPLDGVIELNFDGAMAIQEGVAGGGY